MLGQVRRIKFVRGGYFGFIRVPNDDRDIFFHREDLMNSIGLTTSQSPPRGAMVVFELEEHAGDGNLRARNVTLTGEVQPVVKRRRAPRPPRANWMFERMADRYNE